MFVFVALLNIEATPIALQQDITVPRNSYALKSAAAALFLVCWVLGGFKSLRLTGLLGCMMGWRKWGRVAIED